jgi:OOP family OmpA-OmpF porin
MATAVLSSLFNLLDSRSVNDIASRLGESGHAVSRGLESTTASMIDGLTARSSDTGSMGQIFRLISQTPSDINVSNLAGAVLGPAGATGATASLLDSGKKFLSQAFGGGQSAVGDAIGRSSGLRASSVASLMSVAAPLLMSALGRAVRGGNMTQEGLRNWLVQENAGIKGMLPAGLPAATTAGRAAVDAGARPLSITTVTEPRTGVPGWMWILPVLLLIPLGFWLFNRQHVRVPEAVRTDLGNFVPRTLPDNVRLSIPIRGMEMRLLQFIQDPTKAVNETTWFDFDRLTFDTDSAQLRPESQEQLQNIAEILRAYPNVRVTVGGYTDNTGDAAHNLQLSQDRANGVVDQLVALGISRDRLEARGYGEQFPVGDNATAEGRAKNRRISMRVTQK